MAGHRTLPGRVMATTRRRPRRPDRMTRLRIVLYVMLVLADIDFTNSKTHGRRPRRHQGRWRETPVSHQAIHGEAVISRPEVTGKAAIKAVNGQTVISSPEVNDQAGISSSEVNGNIGVSRPGVYGKGVASRSDVNGKARVSLPEVQRSARVPHQWLTVKDRFSHPVVDRNDLASHLIHRKNKLSSLYIHENVHGVDGSSNKLGQTGKGPSYEYCPSGCECVYLYKERAPLGLRLGPCRYSPIKNLPKYFDLHRHITWWALVSSHLTTLPLEIEELPVVALNLGLNEFTEVPRVLLELPHLEQLYMNNNKLSSLPADVNRWSRMWVLDISHNLITELPQEIGKIKLWLLDVSYNNLKSLPNSISDLSKLKHLYLDGNKLQTLSPCIAKLPKLAFLHVNENELESLPNSICDLSQLLKLYILGNKIQLLPDCLDRLTQLQILDIRYNEIKLLPMSIGGIPNLQSLSISYNKIEELPEEISALSHIVMLDISFNDLHTLPQNLGDLPHLEYLDISNNDLQALPESVVNLGELNVLNVSFNKLQALPHNVQAMTKLSVLDLSNNPLVDIPVLAGGMSQVTCDHCSIQTFPCHLLTEVQVVSITYNGMKTFYCSQYPQIPLMSTLELSGNSLQDLPCDLSLSGLKFFIVSYNNIGSLPSPCITLQHAREINFDHNKLDVLLFSSLCTEGPAMLPLISIDFQNNRIRDIDMDVKPIDIQQSFQSGAVIDLRGNMLMVLDSWPMALSQYIQKISIYLNNNNISEFRGSMGKAFRATQYGSVFSMQRNQIKHFMDIFNGWKITVNTTIDLNTLLTNVYFDLGFNPLSCDCVDYEVYRSMQRTKSGQYQNLKCHEPLSLKGQNPRNIPLWNFTCDVYVRCPDGCTCTNVPHSQTINVTCLSYTQTDIPEEVPDLVKLSYKYRIDICHQNLHELTPRPYLDKVYEIRLSNNSITSIKVNSSSAFKSLKILHLDHNSLERLPDSLIRLTNHTFVELKLGSNPWICDCEVLAMTNWLKVNKHAVTDGKTICCHSPRNMAGKKVVDMKAFMVCAKENHTVMYIIIAVVFTIGCVVFIFLVYLYMSHRARYIKWQLMNDECDGEFKTFDVFVCACSDIDDLAYVEDYLIPELEGRDFRVLYHKEHFDPGKSIHENMVLALDKSKRTLVFFSDRFKESGHSMFEFHYAHNLDIRKKKRRLITIKDTNLDMSKLDSYEVEYFNTHTYLDRDDPKFWKLLENGLPKKRLGRNVRRVP